MATLINEYNWGRALADENPELVRQLAQAYNQTAQAVNSKPGVYNTNGNTLPNVDPPASSQFNASFSIGDIYVRTDTDTAWIMTSRTSLIAVTWTKIT